MSLMDQLLISHELRRIEKMLHAPAQFFNAWVSKGTVILVAVAVLVGGGVAGVSFLSHAFTYRGYTEVQHLLFVPFDHVPNDGGPKVPISFLNASSSAFNFSVLNRWRGSIDYRVLFNLMMPDAVIQSVYGTLIQYSSDPVTSRLVDATMTPITWNVGVTGPHTASGNSSTFTSVDLPNDAGEQFFRAEIAVTFYLVSASMDGTYSMDVGLIAP